MSDVFSTALSGLNNAISTIANATSNIVNASSTTGNLKSNLISSVASAAANANPQDTIDIASNLITIDVAKTNFAADAKVIAVNEKNLKTLIDIKT